MRVMTWRALSMRPHQRHAAPLGLVQDLLAHAAQQGLMDSTRHVI